jgi:nickel-type superoxide dismutase maturation protease
VVATAVLATAVLAATRWVRRYEVTGPSMEPALLPGDRLVVIAPPRPFRPLPKPGDIVAVEDPTMDGRILIKRVTEVDQLRHTLEIVGDHRDASTDSRSFGPVPRSNLVGRAVYRYAPAGRTGRGPWPEETPGLRSPPPPGGVRSPAMASASDDLSRILVDSYLEGIDDRTVEEIRAMRTECQVSEAQLSYLRRLVQGRLDIVHSYLAHPGSETPPDLAKLVEDLPDILSSARGSGPAPKAPPQHLPMLITADTEETDLTTELDALLGPDEIGSLSGRGQEELAELAGKLEALEKQVSRDRRALHLRIDTLQSELVARHKAGRASVDGLLS